MGDVLLRDYMPQPTLEVQRHLMGKPKFPAVDAHNHHRFWSKERGVQDLPRLV